MTTTAVQKARPTEDALVQAATNKIMQKKDQGLRFPKGYNVQNAMAAATLALKEAVNKSGKPLLQTCTPESILAAVIDMAVQGLNPIKKQCYFIAYGNKCVLQRSYFGTLSILKRVANLKREPLANVIWKGDKFKYRIDPMTGLKTITEHEQDFANIGGEIVGAYAIVETDRETIVEIMTMEQIRKAWAQGNGGNSPAHKNFTDQMAIKTVLNRAAKKIINASSDVDLLEYVEDITNATTDTIDTKARVLEEVAQEQGAEVFDEPEVVTVDEPIMADEEADSVAPTDDAQADFKKFAQMSADQPPF